MPEKEFDIENLQNRIYTIRGLQVMLDEDLAALYKVEVKRLNQSVRRNRGRFPEEFCFRLTKEEMRYLRSQIVTLEPYGALKPQNATSEAIPDLRFQIETSKGHGGRRKLPYAFTEQGVAMLSAVLRSETAVKASIRVMNAFVAMRRFIASNARVFARLDSLEIRQLDTEQKVEMVLRAISRIENDYKRGIAATERYNLNIRVATPDEFERPRGFLKDVLIEGIELEGRKGLDRRGSGNKGDWQRKKGNPTGNEAGRAGARRRG